MKKSTKNKIEESISDLEGIGGLKNLDMKKVIVNIKKAIIVTEKSKK